MGRHFSVPKWVKERVRIRLLDKFDAVADNDGPGIAHPDPAGYTKRRLASSQHSSGRMKKLKAFTVVCQADRDRAEG